MTNEKEEDIQKMRVLKDKNKTIIVKNIEKDFSCHKGLIKKEDLIKTASKIKTNKENEMFIFKPTLADIYNIITRKPQIILQKDIGYIIAFCGVNKNSVIVEAGTGTGTTAIILASIAKKVYTYEIREEHFKIAEKNIKMFNLTNIVLKNKDISEMEEKEVDLILLDLPEPWKVIDRAYSALIPGGFLVAYLPNLTQVKKLYESIKSLKFYNYGTKVIYEQNWLIDEKILRPKNREYLTFTAFLTFLRKYE